MTGTHLEERLARLADGDVAARAPRSVDLWARGRRWQRRRRIASAVAATCAVVLTAGLVSAALPLVVEPEVLPASSEGAPVLPDRLYEPSPWLGTLAGTPLVAVVESGRGTWRGQHEAGLVGISATTGEYGFVELPGRAGPTEVALSPDGERLAYWLEGKPSGDPNTQREPGVTLVGVVVRDLRTGQEQRHRVPTEHGLASQTLVWLDSETLAFEYGQLQAGDNGPEESRGASASGGGWWWQVDAGAPRRWPWPRDFLLGGHMTGRDGKVLAREGERFALLDLETEQRLWVRGDSGAGVSINHLSALAYSSDGQVAVVGSKESTQTPNDVWVSRTVQSKGGLVLTDRTRVPDLRAFGFLGWRDGDLLTLQDGASSPAVGDHDSEAITAVDPATGKQQPLVTGEGISLVAWRFAQDLLETAEVVTAPEPPDPVDPRLAAAGWTLGLLAVIGTFLVWRRRAHP